MSAVLHLLQEQAKIWEKLKLVSLRDRGLSSVPTEAIAVADSIEAMDLSINKLASLPDGFSAFRNLRKLSCARNYLSGNELKGEPTLVTSRYYLNCRFNRPEHSVQVRKKLSSLGC